MKNIIVVMICCFFLSCEQKEKNVFSLKYIKNNNELVLCFQNKTPENIIFPVPNTLEFGDKNFKNFSSQGNMEGSFPLTVYALIESNQSSKFYQKKLDSIYDNYLIEIGNGAFVGDERSGDGNSVIYLNSGKEIKLRYRLNIRQSPPVRAYSSKFKQNYYPYGKVLSGNYPEGEYLRRFSKLNFGKAKFMAQPEIKDSLFLNISQSDVTN